MDEPMESVERGAVISISIAGGIVIFVLGAVVIYILRELYCNDHYDNMNSSTRRKTKPQTNPSDSPNKRTVSAINVEPTSSTDRIVPGVRQISLPPVSDNIV